MFNIFSFKNKKLWLFLAVFWLVISTILLTLPGSRFPKEDWLSRIWFDKWVHIFLFGLLTGLWCLAIRGNRKGFIITGVVCLAYGIIMEFIQGTSIPNRSFDHGDIIADGVGCLIAVLYCTGRYIKK